MENMKIILAALVCVALVVDINARFTKRGWCADTEARQVCQAFKERDECWRNEARAKCGTTCNSCGFGCTDATPGCQLIQTINSLCPNKQQVDNDDEGSVAPAFLLCPMTCGLCRETK